MACMPNQTNPKSISEHKGSNRNLKGQFGTKSGRFGEGQILAQALSFHGGPVMVGLVWANACGCECHAPEYQKSGK